MTRRPAPVALALLVAWTVSSGCSGPAASRAPARPAEVYVAPDSVIARLDGVEIVDGGLSALDLGPDGALWTVPDRGPNLDAEAVGGGPAKRFALPDYQPQLARLVLGDGALRLTDRRPIRSPAGRAASGRPPPGAGDADVEAALGPDFAPLPPDPWGVDAEGLAFDGGDVWLAEEYRPSLWRIDARSGTVRERWTPAPTEAVDRPLPPVLAGRQPNLGFEGVAVLGGAVVASLQGPIQTPETDPATPFVRLLRLDAEAGTAATFAYPMDGPLRKVGDLAAAGDRLLVLEHGPDGAGRWSGQVYAVSLQGAAPLADALPERFATAAEAERSGIGVLDKRLVLDLLAAGWPPSLHKPEGLAVLPGGRLAVLADNDYGVDAPALDGRAVATGARSTLVVFGVPGLASVAPVR